MISSNPVTFFFKSHLGDPYLLLRTDYPDLLFPANISYFLNNIHSQIKVKIKIKKRD